KLETKYQQRKQRSKAERVKKRRTEIEDEDELFLQLSFKGKHCRNQSQHDPTVPCCWELDFGRPIQSQRSSRFRGRRRHAPNSVLGGLQLLLVYMHAWYRDADGMTGGE